MSEARVYVGPDPNERIAEAVERAGGLLVAPEEANAFVWVRSRPETIRELLHPGVRWVQLNSAGVEQWFEERALDDERVWTGAQGTYAPDVAEHAVAFVLAAARRLPQSARRRQWGDVAGKPLRGRTVGIVGAGAIGREVIARLAPFNVRTLALTRSGRAVSGAERSLPPDGLDELLRESDYAILAAPLTDETRGMIAARELDLIGKDGWLVNIGRGALVATDALVRALAEERIAGACLDVTDPEPLPDSHPLWTLENVLITPHVANPPGTIYELLAERVAENVARFREGRDLLGAIDIARGY